MIDENSADNKHHLVDDEWGYLLAQVSSDPDFPDIYTLVVTRLVDGVYSWMMCGQFEDPEDAKVRVVKSIENFKRYPLEWHVNTAVPAPAKESIFEIAANAAAGGHNLSSFYLVEDQDINPNGYEARCHNCGMTAWVSFSGLQYSLLADVCLNE